MNKTHFLLFLGLFSAAVVFPQAKKEVLLTVGGKPVYASEFKRVYNKNLELVQDEAQKDIDGYLDLFIDYKLKLAEARAQGLHEKDLYQREFRQYEEQLSRSYIFEDKITQELAKEAYQRGLEEINASHILIQIGYDASPKDTLAAWNKINSIREKALKGEDFATLAATHSEEPNAKESKGNLGYFTVFTMVYPFETAAYNTKEGGISEIVRTQFGYHIIKVNDRREKLPQLEVSHIMISNQKKDSASDPKQRAQEIYAMLQQGEPFENLAKQFSDDKNSAIKGGKLNAFSKGDLRSETFENAAYALKNPGDISAPVETKFGWHVIRLDRKLPIPTYEDQREMLEKKVSEPGRSKIVAHAVNKKIKDKFGFKKGADYLGFFNTYLGETFKNKTWATDTLKPSDNKTIFTIGDRELKFTDFAEYVHERKSTARPFQIKGMGPQDYYDEFETRALKDYFKENLEKENADYAAILSEYRDGLLIFDAMSTNIWQKAQNDSLGLQAFYERTKNKYMSKPGVVADIYSSPDKTVAERAQQLIKEGSKTAEEIKASLNGEGTINVILTSGNFDMDQRNLPENFDAKVGVSEIYPSHGSFVVVNVKEMTPAAIQPLEQIKGRALSDYQDYLEKQWLKELREKYTVEVNKKTLKRVKKELN